MSNSQHFYISTYIEVVGKLYSTPLYRTLLSSPLLPMLHPASNYPTSLSNCHCDIVNSATLSNSGPDHFRADTPLCNLQSQLSYVLVCPHTILGLSSWLSLSPALPPGITAFNNGLHYIPTCFISAILHIYMVHLAAPPPRSFYSIL